MIGILTFHRGPNYGGFLQAWHMREAIRSLGHEATLVNYQTARHHEAEKVRLRALRPGPIKGFLLHALKSRPFPKHVAELSDHPFTTDPEGIDWRRFSSVVVGADIVWNYTSSLFGFDPVFYGAHPSQKQTRLVAYAPSCGATSRDEPVPKHVEDGLGRFEKIQVRDEATADLVSRVISCEPPLVVDPTWLQEDPVFPYRKRPRQPYALVYGHGVSPERAVALKEYCKKRGLKLVACAFPCQKADQRILSIGPFEWADLFREAECVITSTFHGLLYTIKYRQPLIFMPNPASRSKSQLVIERCGLEDRVVEVGEPFDPATLERNLDPSRPTEVPSEWVRKSREYLAESL